MAGQAGKGGRYRPVNQKKYDDEDERIFGESRRRREEAKRIARLAREHR